MKGPRSSRSGNGKAVGLRQQQQQQKTFERRLQPAASRNSRPSQHDEDTERAMRRMQAFDMPSDQGSGDEEGSQGEDLSDGDVLGEGANAYGSDMSGEDASETGSEEDLDNSSDEGDDEIHGDDDEDDAAQLARIKRELADVPFDQLIEIQQKIGMKKFHENFRGKKGEQASEEEGSDEEESESGERKASGRGTGRKEDLFKKDKEKKPLPKLAKRANKNMPTEVTSKRQVTRRREVVEIPKLKTRDPRFDPLAGKLNEALFNTSYGFIREYEESEIELLRKQIVTTKDPKAKERLTNTLQSMTSRIQTRKAKEKRQEMLREWKKTERAAVAQGKKPWQLKKSDIKKMELVEKYKSMKEKDIDKLLEKRRKKNAAKERRFLPYNRRSAA